VPVAPLTEIERAALRELVVVERARAQQRLSSLERTFDEMVDAADLEPPDDEHDPEGTTAYERAQVASLAAEARARLTQLDRALTELDEGYGACQRCGQPIGWPRLQALPGTTCCVRCAVSPPAEIVATPVGKPDISRDRGSGRLR
jgi:RNA polymerase-binding transcription factor DksA